MNNYIFKFGENEYQINLILNDMNLISDEIVLFSDGAEVDFYLRNQILESFYEELKFEYKWK